MHVTVFRFLTNNCQAKDSTPNTADSTPSFPSNFGFNLGANKSQVTSQSISQQPTVSAANLQPSSINSFFAPPHSTPQLGPTAQTPASQRPLLPQLPSFSQVKDSTTPAGSPVRENHPIFTQPSLSTSSQAVTKVPVQPPPQPNQPQKPIIDRQELLHQLCRLGLVQRDGVLDMFIGLRVSQLVRDVFNKFQNQELEKKTCKSLSLSAFIHTDS